MSILPLPQIFGLAVSLFHHPGGIEVTDVQYEKQGSRDVQNVERQRNIAAAVDKGGAKRLENIFGGSVADGDVGLWTSETLYIADVYEPGEPQRQSFFVYEGLTYRVCGKDPWKGQTGQDIYLGKRHVAQEIV
jgi:hypothetical protein